MEEAYVVMRCPFCGEEHQVLVKTVEYYAWLGGELIHYAMPNLSPTEREQLISKLCPRCQTEVFGIC